MSTFRIDEEALLALKTENKKLQNAIKELLACTDGFESLEPRSTPKDNGIEIVYYIKSSKYIKIGKSAQHAFKNRFQALQHGNQHHLKLVAVELGGLIKEHERHIQFDSLRVRGEWFRYEGALKAHILNLQAVTSMGKHTDRMKKAAGAHYRLETAKAKARRSTDYVGKIKPA